MLLLNDYLETLFRAGIQSVSFAPTDTGIMCRANVVIQGDVVTFPRTAKTATAALRASLASLQQWEVCVQAQKLLAVELPDDEST